MAHFPSGIGFTFFHLAFWYGFMPLMDFFSLWIEVLDPLPILSQLGEEQE